MHLSTISREVRRRFWRPVNTSAADTRYRPAGLRSIPVTERSYRASRAQGHAQVCRARSHRPHRMGRDDQVDYVISRLRWARTRLRSPAGCRSTSLTIGACG